MKIKNTPKQLQQKLINHPFFPLLFIGKAAENTAYYIFANTELHVVLATYLMAAVTTVLWLRADGDFDF
jgi:hypothetical protein